MSKTNIETQEVPKAVRNYFRRVGRKGALKTNAALTPEERKESARRAAKARWAERKLAAEAGK